MNLVYCKIEQLNLINALDYANYVTCHAINRTVEQNSIEFKFKNMF